MGDLRALAANGNIVVTEERQYGDMVFVVTEVGRKQADRLKLGGLSEAEEQRGRAEKAEALLRDHVANDTRTVEAAEERRQRLAGALAWIPAVVLAIVIAFALFALSDSPQFRFVIGVLLALGVAGSWVIQPVRNAIAAGLVNALRAVHDRT
jgi:hypothetical protein